MVDDLEKTKDDIPLSDDVAIDPGKYTSSKVKGDVPYPRLEMIAGPQEGIAYPLKEGEQVLGREKKGEVIFLDDTSVSRNHAKIVVKGSTITIEDLESRNGTYVNTQKLGKIDRQTLAHLDQIKLGIYIFRLAMKPITEEELAQLAKDSAKKSTSKEASFVASSDKPEKKPEEKKPASAEAMAGKEEKDIKKEEEFKSLIKPISPPVSKEPPSSPGSRLIVIFLIVCLISGLAGLSYFLYSRYFEKPVEEETTVDSRQSIVESKETGDRSQETEDKKQEAGLSAEALAKAESRKQEAEKQEAEKQEARDKKQEARIEEKKPKPRTFHAFLDVKSKPTKARIIFEDKHVGSTPLKTHVELVPSQEYTVIAEFDLKDVHDRYQQKKTFTADVRKEVFSLEFDADIGIIKILRLPRSVNFYLEGYYAYDKYKAHPVRLEDIIYGKPVYVPFGQYVVELREKVRVGKSDTYIPEIRYHREFNINEERKLVELTINERDLQFFPAKIRSAPSGADVYLDGEKIGATPFSGELPLGKHELKLVREGFFDHQIPLDMRTNTPYETKIELKTSKVGGFINKAKELRRAGQYQTAINKLIDALKLESSQREKAEVHLLLGDSYYMLGNIEQASVYFEQAKSHKDFYYNALLGLARTQYSMGNHKRSLILLIEVMLNTKQRSTLKKEAGVLFKRLSPIKSVIYISSEPKGATVSINNREVGQKTPVILSDLSLGAYRIEISKRGYQPSQVRKNLKLGEFVPIFVTLKQEKI